VIKNLLKRLAARFPSELPRDASGMDAYICDILTTYRLPNTPSYKTAVAKAIHAVSQNTHKAPKLYFYQHLRRYEAMLAAVVKISDLEKEKQAATPPKPEKAAESPIQIAGIQSPSA
jgi:hypothetical protein